MSIRNFATKLKMKREEFWKYISISHKKAKNNNEFVDYLIDILSKKTDEEIFDFEIITFELMHESYNEKLWCADRKSTRLNSSHTMISYAVFCLKKKTCRVLSLP